MSVGHCPANQWGEERNSRKTTIDFFMFELFIFLVGVNVCLPSHHPIPSYCGKNRFVTLTVAAIRSIWLDGRNCFVSGGHIQPKNGSCVKPTRVEGFTQLWFCRNGRKRMGGSDVHLVECFKAKILATVQMSKSSSGLFILSQLFGWSGYIFQWFSIRHGPIISEYSANPPLFRANE